MPDSYRSSLLLGALALMIAVAGVLAPRGASGVAPAASGCAGGGDTPFELVLFGTSRDDLRLRSDAAPLVVYRVPAGFELSLTDVDATSCGLVLWRRSQQRLEQVGFVVDRAAVGLGQSSRTYASGIRLLPDDELLVGAAGCDVEWAALRGVLSPLEPRPSGS